jgi:hypothetical protein
MAQVAKEREASVKELEEGLTDLEKREKELKEKIALLQSVPIPVAEHFARLVEPGEKRSARRDYLLFRRDEGRGLAIKHFQNHNGSRH